MKNRRKRSSSSDTVAFLKEKCEREMKKNKQQNKANQFQIMVKKTLLQAIPHQQAQQQQQQSHNLHMIMAQQNLAIMSLLQKVMPKH